MAAAGFRTTALALACAACTSIAIDARTFEGTRWRVTAVNGRATPSLGRFRVEFRRDSFAARFGCNTASGSYSIEGTLVRPGLVAITQMSCIETRPAPVPIMTWEKWGSSVISRPMRMDWRSGRHLVLSNAAGSIELDRLP
jgi:heat shock protein HslJ